MIGKFQCFHNLDFIIFEPIVLTTLSHNINKNFRGKITTFRHVHIFLVLVTDEYFRYGIFIISNSKIVGFYLSYYSFSNFFAIVFIISILLAVIVSLIFSQWNRNLYIKIKRSKRRKKNWTILISKYSWYVW